MAQLFFMLTPDDFRAVGSLLELKHPGLLKEPKAHRWTVAHFIAAFGTAEHMAQFCYSYPAAFSLLTSTGLTPLQVALQYGNYDTASVLLQWYLVSQ